MSDDNGIKPGSEVKIKPKSIVKRASKSARKFIRRTKQAARKNGPVTR